MLLLIDMNQMGSVSLYKITVHICERIVFLKSMEGVSGWYNCIRKVIEETFVDSGHKEAWFKVPSILAGMNWRVI